MEISRFYTFIICCIVIVVDIYAADDFRRGLLFGQEAHDNSQSLYIASVNVGSGECHIIRKGDNAIIVDSGVRGASISEVVSFVEGALGHDLRDTKGGMLFSQATLCAFFITHPHHDHTNIIQPIMDDKNILKDQNLRAFLGGLGDHYEEDLVNLFEERALLRNGEYEIAGFAISAHDVDSDLEFGQGDQDINRFGAVIGLSFAARRIAFMGDIDFDGFKGIVGINVGEYVIGQQDNASTHPMRDFLLQADILTAPHHGTLKNLEGGVYNSLLLSKKDRVFLVSGSPLAPSPIMSDILAYLKPANETWLHALFLQNCFFNHESKKFEAVVLSNKTTIPLFSTYNAPNGFIWVKITPDGAVSIYNNSIFSASLTLDSDNSFGHCSAGLYDF